MAGGGTRALDELRRRRIEHRVHEYESEAGGRTGSSSRGWGAAAAAALGVDPHRIHKTLVAAVDGRLVVAVVAVAAEVDLKALAAAVSGRRAAMADPAEAERATGYVRGGISPIGQRRRLPTVVDRGALAWPTILVSGGRRGLQVELAPADLVAVSAATVTDITVAARVS